MRAIDTNVLVRLIARDEPKQTGVAERFVATGAWVSQLVLVEAVWVLDSVYGLGKDRIALAVEMLLNHAQLAIQEAEVVESALARYRRRAAPEFSDCLSLEVALKAGNLPLGTFGRALGAMDGAERL